MDLLWESEKLVTARSLIVLNTSTMEKFFFEQKDLCEWKMDWNTSAILV